MLNLAINRNESKKFICYYKEIDEEIIVKYGDHSKNTYKNSSYNREILNTIMEEQVRNGDLYFTDESSKIRIDSRQHLGRLFFIYSLFSAMFGVITIPIANFFELNNIVGTYAFAISGGFLVLPINNIIKAMDLKKNKMFLENKETINQYLKDYSGTSLSINDIHSLNIGSVIFTCLKANKYNRTLSLKRERDLLCEKVSDKRLIK